MDKQKNWTLFRIDNLSIIGKEPQYAVARMKEGVPLLLKTYGSISELRERYGPIKKGAAARKLPKPVALETLDFDSRIARILNEDLE